MLSLGSLSRREGGRVTRRAALHAGAHAMDRHFATAPLDRNLPVVLALAGLWNATALGYRQRVVVPYAEALALMPAYLQQLSLESNGKRVTREGAPVEGRTAPALWGGIGTDGQAVAREGSNGGQTAAMAAADIEHMIQRTDIDGRNGALIFAPGFPGHDGCDDPAKQPACVARLPGNEMRSAHLPSAIVIMPFGWNGTQ